MSIQIQKNQEVNNLFFAEKFEAQKQEEKKDEKKASLFLGDLHLGGDTDNRVAQKKEMARKQAAKIVEDAMERFQKGVDSVDAVKDVKSKKVAEYLEKKAMYSQSEKDKKRIQEAYGVMDDSQEQKDLELLERYQNDVYGMESGQFSKEEIERL